MSANFIVSAPQAETLDAELKEVVNGEGIIDVKPIAPEASSEIAL
jgi:hypothetical protein